MQGQLYELKCEQESLSDKSLGRGDAGIIIHLDKLFILHMALLSAGQSAPAHTFANVLTCMYSTASTGPGLQLRYMALIRVTKMQNNETSGRRVRKSVRREESEDGNVMPRSAYGRVAVGANSDTQRRVCTSIVLKN